jgi:hypothetical protein
MSETLIRCRAAVAVLAAVLALAAAPQAPAAASAHAAAERRITEAQHREAQRHLARERQLAHERRVVRGRRLQARLRTERHWYYRGHQLVYAHAPPHRHAAPPAQTTAPATPAPAPAAKPAAKPAALVRPHRERIVVKPAAQPVALQGPPARPIQGAMALPLITTAQAAPAATPAQAAAAPAVDLGTQLGELTTAAALEMKDARLDLPAALSSGGQGKVVLTLPPDLLSAIQAKAAAVGLKSSARKVFISARLAGQGYQVTPNGQQSARVDAGPTIFAWDVAPSAAAGGVLTADMTGSLQGEDDAKTFALGAVTAQIPPPAQPASAAAPAQAPAAAPSKLKLPDLGHWILRLHDLAIPGHPTVTVPGLGPVASEKLVAAGLIALILIMLIAIARSAGARRERAERRRRFHDFEAADFGDGQT